MRRSKMFKVLGLLGVALTVLVVQVLPAVAEEDGWKGPHNYYLLSDPAVESLLNNVNKYHLSQAREKLLAKEYGYAYQDIDFMLRYFPNHPQALVMMTEWGLATNQLAKSEQFIKKALVMYPGNAQTHTVYGFALQKSGRLEEAIAQYRKALKIDPNSAIVHYNLGLASFSQKRYDQANSEANAAYNLGYPLMGLRRKLQRVGAWKALPKPEAHGPQPSAADAGEKQDQGR